MKTFHLKPYEVLFVILPLVFGALAFLLVVGHRAINPTNIAWLELGDTSTYYLGWLFFRNAEWSFPIGLNPNYGLELSNAIVFSDSNPLLAFLFKPFSFVLPQTFQYFGIWMLLCFMLQAWFGWKLVGLITENLLVRVISTGLFVFAPPMMWRIQGHLILVGHFFILAALYLMLNRKLIRRKWAWGVLLVVTALVHAYFLAMVSLLWLADFSGKALQKILSARMAFLELVTMVSLVAFFCWQAGYFSVGSGVSSDGYGSYRMNLLSLFDSNGWSYFIKDIPGGDGDYEGFNFLGLGLIFLLVSALPAFFSNKTLIVSEIRKEPVILLAFLALTVFAVSNKLGIGAFELEFPLPELAIDVANIFRSSGRMFWPVFYGILFTLIFLVVRGYEKRTAIILIGLALGIQVMDLSAAYQGIRNKLMAESKSRWQSPLTAHFWEHAASKYTKVRWIPPANYTPKWHPLATFAGTHGLSTDAVYLARIGTSALKSAQKKARDAIRTGVYEADSLYILDDNAFRKAVIHLNEDSHLLAHVDGFNVIAPGWNECADCLAIYDVVNNGSKLPPLSLGERLPLNPSGRGLSYLTSGWSHPEPWGIWSEGTKATITLPLSSVPPKSVLLEVHPLLSANHKKQNVEVLVNGHFIGKFMLTKDGNQEFEVKIPSPSLEETKTNKLLQLDLHFPDAARPRDIGINEDTRTLAIGLVALTVR